MMDKTHLSYWDQAAATKTFSHPVNDDWLRDHLRLDARILDYGCGYGRVAAMLHARGYRNVVGVDASAGMIERARELCPHTSFHRIDPPNVPFPDAHFDAALLFTVLTCTAKDDDQRAVLAELHRVVRPGGVLYVSDLWLQTDLRNHDRYARGLAKYGTYGVFEVAGGVTVRHHSREWIDLLLRRWEPIAQSNLQVTTMNGHEAAGFQWLGQRPGN